MLDEKDLAAIRSIVKEEVTTAVKEEVSAAEQRIIKNTVALMDMEFSKQFKTLAEGQQDILNKLVPRARVDELEDEVRFLKSIIRQINEDVQRLKKAT